VVLQVVVTAVEHFSRVGYLAEVSQPLRPRSQAQKEL